MQIFVADMCCLYTNHKLSERKIKKTNPFTVASGRIKYLKVKDKNRIKALLEENSNELLRLCFMGS